MFIDSRTVVVCVPAATPVEDLVDVAGARLATLGLTTHGPVGHFVVHPGPAPRRFIRGKRRPTPTLTYGGPIRQLDLAGMRHGAAAHAAELWQLWQQVVAKTPPARPYWSFEDRHYEDPQRWPLARAQLAYTSQPRYQAMAVYNAAVHPVHQLSTDHLEAFQAGADAYTRLAALAAVPADAVATVPADAVAVASGPPGWFTPTSARLADLVAYLTLANRLLDSLPLDTRLAALTAS
ncbi:hypothetical protein ACTMTJ_34880 [Phytohabitans sp. LJ34]|uniref:hypothetical protein n=1 Tax=Phytohabitans sp. LJ34 TaxID=3452217 RepID=UPI003F89C3D1